jgi:RNA polymerase sigma factor (sigma-70 family)
MGMAVPADAGLEKELPGDAEAEPIDRVITREEGRLRNFIRKQVYDESDAEDVLQDVFCELIKAYEALTPLRQTTAWLYRVARNRIVDLFRRRSADRARLELPVMGEDGEFQSIEAWLPSADGGPEAAYARRVLLEELDLALDELPSAQRDVFIAHELEGRSFKELAETSGLPVATLLSRKHYAVLHLRKRLQSIYKEFANA